MSPGFPTLRRWRSRPWRPREAICIRNGTARLEALGVSSDHQGGVTDYVITHNGVPIGTVDLPRDGDRFTVPVTPLAGYEVVRPLVRRASAALADVALGHPPNAVLLGRVAELGAALELRDGAGSLVPVDFIELTDWPGGAPEVAAFIQLRDAHAPVPAAVPSQPRTGSDTAAPAA